MAITRQISSTPSFFNFLKEGLLLPRHNPRLFATIFTIMAASSCLLRLGNDLAAVQPLTDEIHTNTKALNSTDPSSPADILQVTQKKTQDDTWALLLTRVAYYLFGVIIRSAIEIVVLFAAVATYSGEPHTFGSLLGQAKKRLKGPVLTRAFALALEIASVALLGAMGGLLVFLVSIKIKYYGLSLVVPLLVLIAVLFPLLIYLVYFSCFLCPMSVVVAVAEPGRYGAGALGRARRLVKGKRRRAVLFISVTTVLTVALTRVYGLAKRYELITNMAAAGFLYSILMSAVQLFEACAMAAFYYECKGSTKASEFLPRTKLMLD